jgi:hypothetical protein
MKALKIGGIVAVLLWMAWISLETEHTKNIAYEACAFALAATGHPAGSIPLPLNCPNLANDEVGPQKSN